MTRREAVLRYLQARPNQWVAGRAGGRILDLRKSGFDIKSRPSKRSAVWEYMLVDERQLALGLVA